MSAPATNARSPAPVKTTAPTSSSVCSLGEDGAEVVLHLPVDRVADVGAVDRDDRDAVAHVYQQRVVHQTASSIREMPWPTPMHMVTSARLAPTVGQLEGGGQGEPGTARAQRVAQGDRAAVGVDVLGVVREAQPAQHREGLRGERLVQLDARRGR